MTSKEKLELEMLACQMIAMGGRLRDAARLLEAAEAATRLIDQVRKLTDQASQLGGERNSEIAAAPRPRAAALDARGVARTVSDQVAALGRRTLTPTPAVGRAVPIGQRREFGSPPTAESRSGVIAVFDQDAVDRRQHTKKTTEQAVPF